MKQRKEIKIGHLFRFVLCLGITILLACLLRFGVFDKTSNPSIITTSTLTKAIDVAELSTAEFRYRGIADIYTDESRTQVRCRVCYSATVKAGIDMTKVQLVTDTSNKIVKATLPEIELKVTIVDEESMSLLPSNADVGIDSMLKFCKEDAESEAMASDALINTARENLMATIEGLLYPILKAHDYTIAWE